MPKEIKEKEKEPVEILFSNEIVWAGHPDKVADSIGAALLKEYISKDKDTHAGIEVMGGKGIIFVTGEVTSKARVNVKKVVKRVLKDRGYRTNYKIINNIGLQSPDINRGVSQLGGEIGAGDQGMCISEGTLISTDRGYVPIECVNETDKVLVSSGNMQKVLKVTDMGVKSVVRLTTNFGRELVCTPDHKIYTTDGWVEAKETYGKAVNNNSRNIFGDFRYSRKITQEQDNPHGGKLAFNNEEFELNEDTAYIAGIMTGDGDFTRNNGLTVACVIPEKREVFYNAFVKVFGEQVKTTESGVYIYSKGVRRFYEELGFGYKKCYEKEIPSSILQSPKNIQVAYLRGLFDSDGGATYFKHHNWFETHLNYSSSSRKLITQIALLLRNLGIECKEKDCGVAISKNIIGKRNIYCVEIVKYSAITKFNEEIKFNVKYKQDKLMLGITGHTPKYELNKPEIIVKIEEVEDTHVYDITVENEHEFYANGVLVHNCFGYACNDTPEMLPTAMVILQKLARMYEDIRKDNPKDFYPDGKAQITGVYDENMKLKRIKTFVISYQNAEVNRDKTDEILKSVASSIASEYGIKIDEFLINPTGKFLIGGFDGDAGLTGRKIVVDAYQSFANVGGGNTNAKDPSKVDFSAAHKARQLAKRIVKNEKLRWAEVQLSYAIGVAEPVAIYIRSNRGYLPVPKTWYKECKPANIIKDLDLLNADYEEMARFGHFTK